jgi:hypothetical protein
LLAIKANKSDYCDLPIVTPSYLEVLVNLPINSHYTLTPSVNEAEQVVFQPEFSKDKIFLIMQAVLQIRQTSVVVFQVVVFQVVA